MANLVETCEAASKLDGVVVFWEEATDRDDLAQALRSAIEVAAAEGRPPRIALVVGPEGGLDEREVAAFLEANPHARVATLGPSILRTETAGIVASALALYELRPRFDSTCE